jgi:hypothetical protein
MTDRFQTVAARKVEREATEAFHALAAAEDDEDLFILTGLLLEEQLDRERLELMARLLKRAPRLSMGTGRWRRPFLYGAATGYATHGRTIVMEGGEFYAAFRFDRGHVAELVERLCIPESVKLPCGGRLAGDEALLITLRMLAYPARGTDLSHFFRRSTGSMTCTRPCSLSRLSATSNTSSSTLQSVLLIPRLRSKTAPSRSARMTTWSSF